MAYDAGANWPTDVHAMRSATAGTISVIVVSGNHTPPPTPGSGGSGAFPVPAVGYLWPSGDGPPGPS